MAVKKSELYSTLWKCCDELRGGMDASQYKDYVLAILFVKYISDKSTSDPSFTISIPDGCHFDDFVALKGHSNIGEQMNKKFEGIAGANIELENVIIADFDDDQKLGKGKDKVDTLSNLIAVFQNSDLDFSQNRAADDDLIGDAYEYLMKNFATESGKSKGQFYTPGEVSRVMAKVIGLNRTTKGIRTTIYDPTCGSGSLLLRARYETPDGATIYGQEKDNATVGLAKMNMILHGEDFAEIRQGDTINAPYYKDDLGNLTTFDYIVANPPFSTKSWLKSAKEEDIFGRWGSAIGVPPEKNGDYAFLLHIARSLKQTGCGACILPHGVLFRGNAEAQIRKYLVSEKKIIKGIIGLPANLFFGTGIPACIIILDKSEANDRKGVFMIDAKNGYTKDGPKNRLREQDIRRIVDTWNAGRDVAHYARFVSLEEIENNDFNLNLPRYIEAEDTQIQQDIDAHLHGGLPRHDVEQLDEYWMACPSLKDALFKEHDTRAGYYKLSCSEDSIRDTIAQNEDFIKQTNVFYQSFDSWCQTHRDELFGLEQGFAPKQLIERLGSSILDIFKSSCSLVDAYDVYDCLLNYWGETMQDDCYLITANGWVANPYTPQPAAKKKDAKPKEKKATSIEDIACDLLPISVVVEEYFSEQQACIVAAEEHQSDLESQLNELLEEQAEEYLSEENFPEGKLNDGNVKKRIKSLGKEEREELEVLNRYLSLRADIATSKKVIKTLKYDLLTAVSVRYTTLTEDDIKRLVVEKKWFASLHGLLTSEMERISQALSAKVTELADRYKYTLSDIDSEISDLEHRVAEHLKQMGF